MEIPLHVLKHWTRTRAKRTAMRACCVSAASEEATQRVVARLREQVERRRALLRRGGALEGDSNGMEKDNQGVEKVRASLRESRSEVGRLRAEMGVMQKEYERAKKRSSESELLALQLLERSKNGLRELEEKNERIVEVTNMLEKYEMELEAKSRELELAQNMLAQKNEENISLKGETLRLKDALKTATANISRWTSSLFQLKKVVEGEAPEGTDESVVRQMQRIQDRYAGAFVVLQDIAELTKSVAQQAAQDNEALQIHAPTSAPSDNGNGVEEEQTSSMEDGPLATIEPSDEDVAVHRGNMETAEKEEGDGWILYRFKS